MDNTKQERWTRIVNDYQQSGLTLRAFCKEHELSYYQLQYWRKRFKKQPACSDRTAFMPLKVKRNTLSTISIWHGEFRIELTADFDPDILQRLLRCFQ